MTKVRHQALVALAWVAVQALACAQAHAQLNDAEQRISDSIRQRSSAALQFLEKTVRINSGTLNVDGVREVGQLYRAEFEALGFTTRWAEMPAQMRRAGHLIAIRTPGAGNIANAVYAANAAGALSATGAVSAAGVANAPRLLLLGHMDTVFEKGSSVALWERRGDRVRGQGVNDMKGGNLVMLEALHALNFIGALDGATISVILTGDEERTGSPLALARADLVELAKQSDAALSFEANGPRGEASITRRSSGGWTLTVKARPGHSAGVFSSGAGYGAVFEAARILNAFREQLIEPYLTFNPGVAVGGTKVEYADATATGSAFGKNNVIAKEFIVRGDLRFLTSEQGARTQSKMREIVGASLPGTSATIEFRDGYPPMPATARGEKLLALYSNASQDAGFGRSLAMDPARRGAGDIQFAAPHVAGIDGLGARGSGSHTDDEDLEIASIERNAIRAAIFIHRLITAP